MYQNKKKTGIENKKTAITAAPATVSRAATGLEDNRPAKIVQQRKTNANASLHTGNQVVQRRLIIAGEETSGGKIINSSERMEEPGFEDALKKIPNASEVITRLYRMHNGGNPPVYKYSGWPEAVKNISDKLTGNDDMDSDERIVEDEKRTSVSKNYELFIQTVKKTYDTVYPGIAEKYREVAKQSKTGANDSHMSLAQAATHAAWLQSYTSVLSKKGNTLTKNEKKKIKAKIAHHGLKAKQKGEEHHTQ